MQVGTTRWFSKTKCMPEPDTSLLKPPPDSDNTKQISLWSAITHICLNDNRSWHKKKCMPEPLPQRDVLGSMRSWNSLSFLPFSSDISGSRRSAADSGVWESKGASNTRMRYHHANRQILKLTMGGRAPTLALMNSSKQPTLRFSQFKACSLIQWNCNWRHTRCKGLLQQQRQKSGTSAMS